MLNCWCITWPVGFKRLRAFQHYDLITQECGTWIVTSDLGYRYFMGLIPSDKYGLSLTSLLCHTQGCVGCVNRVKKVYRSKNKSLSDKIMRSLCTDKVQAYRTPVLTSRYCDVFDTVVSIDFQTILLKVFEAVFRLPEHLFRTNCDTVSCKLASHFSYS
jgi:hypothetical protein